MWLGYRLLASSNRFYRKLKILSILIQLFYFLITALFPEILDIAGY